MCATQVKIGFNCHSETLLLESVSYDFKKKSLSAIVFADECTRTGGNIHELFLREES